MEFEVRFGRLKVGNAHMEVVALEQLRGRPAWHTAFWVQGGNFLYRVNDVYESWIDAETLSSLRFVQELEEGTASSALSDDERFGLVLGITCHAIYHAGQVQLIKRLQGA